MSNEILSMSDEELMSYVFQEETDHTQSDGQAVQEPVSSTDEQTDVPDESVNDTFDESVQENTQTGNVVSDDMIDTDKTVNESPTPEETQEVDYQAFYQKMTMPFKANGREIQVDNADDAIRLMQMGANYSKKMEALKPKQALLRALEENGLTSKEQLGYLIDLANKKPEAIAKLIQESQIDLYDFDTAQAENYQPTQVIKEPTAFEDTLSEILEINPKMQQVVNDMSAWDLESKNILYDNPNILRIMSEQQSNGLYSKIVNKIANEKLFGRLNNMNFLQAYTMFEKEFLDSQSSFTAPRPNNNKPIQQPQTANTKSKASLPSTNAKTTQVQANPLTMSDEELLAYVQTLT